MVKMNRAMNRTMNRSWLKSLMPPVLRRAAMALRDALNGPGIEYDVLRDYVFAPDPAPAPRINLILPAVSAQTEFGGVSTGLNFFADLAVRLAEVGAEARIITEKALGDAGQVLAKYPGLAACETLALGDANNTLPTRRTDIFIVFNWWTSLNVEPVLAAQAAHFDQKPHPKLYLIQEYEPHFYPFSAAHLLAREAMGASWPLWAVFNTHEIYDFWQAQGHRAEKTYVFEPRMNAAIRPFLDNLDVADKTRTLLVYGRPQVARNAFFLVRKGLEHWARAHGAAHPDWRIVSAGMKHADIALGGGHHLRSLGKLSLEDYGRLLRETAVGLSLMSSPHPSYPPLEMAHFGVRVLTNAYANKRPSERHENLIALRSIQPKAVAEGLEAAIAGFEADPAKGLKARSHMLDYLGEDRVDCAHAVATDIIALIKARGGNISSQDEGDAGVSKNQ